MIRALTIVIALGSASAAMAQEPSGCDKFKRPVEREHALLAAATTKARFGTELPEIPAAATRIELRAFDKTTLPATPERIPRDKATFAGFLKIAKVARPGLYAVSLSTNGWVDAVQDGKHLKTVAFTGATDCDGIRKVVKFDVGNAPLLIQVTGVASDSIAIAITPSTEQP
jgi:hypothetical protein